MHELDHLLWEELRLSEGEKRFADATGVTPAFGGEHPHAGTHNSLLSLGRGKYLEVIALDPARPETANLLKEVPLGFTPRLFTFGVKAYDLALVEKLVEEAGLNITGLHDISRLSPEGHVLKWRTVVVGGHDFGNFIPFFTRCGEMVHPSQTSPQGCELLEFSVGHPQHLELVQLYKALRVNVPVVESQHPELRAVLSTPKGVVTLSSNGLQT